MKKIFLTALCLGLTLAAAADIKTQLEFSTDGGKNWSEEFPILKKSNPRCKVKVKYQVDEPKEIAGKIVTSMLHSKERDFASANRGLQHFEGRGWYQQLEVYWKNARTGAPYVYDLDLGERKEGVAGKNNIWDKNQGKFVSAPLPACPAFGPGSYKFHVRVGYSTKEDKKQYKSIQTFDIVIEE